MQVISLFSGIEGFGEAAKKMGWDVVVSCEINTFCRTVIEGHWPNGYHHTDIKTLTYEIIKEKSRWNPAKPTIIVGGFPCQPYSTAGKRLGKDDERHLWPEMLRLISEIKPDFVVGENVRGLLSWSDGLVFEEVCIDLETQGYEVWPYILPAAGVGAPHRRDRIWFVAANTNSDGLKPRGLGENRPAPGEGESQEHKWERLWPHHWGTSEQRAIANANNAKLQRGKQYRSFGEEGQVKRESRYVGGSVCSVWDNFPTQSPLRVRDDGFSTESLRQRIREDSMGHLSEKEIDQIISTALTQWNNETIKAAGNAIVPQVVLNIFKSIQLLVHENT